MKHFVHVSCILTALGPVNFSHIALYYNGIKGFDRPDDVTVQAAAEWWEGAALNPYYCKEDDNPR